ncbi:hypothetical protein BHE74_00012434 [Ensete ventricosum]|nr:hypothetical protein BHE74_00012434 [Ensete ventricosum]
MAMEMEMEMEGFLRECERSGDAAYAALKSILEKLENPATRSDARVFLARVQQRFHAKDDADRCFRTYHFRIHDVLLHDFQGRGFPPISVLLPLPSPLSIVTLPFLIVFGIYLLT